MLPLKVPGEQEPVLLPQTTHVFSVYGMDALDQKKLEEICFRSEKGGRASWKTAGRSGDRRGPDKSLPVMNRAGKKAVQSRQSILLY